MNKNILKQKNTRRNSIGVILALAKKGLKEVLDEVARKNTINIKFDRSNNFYNILNEINTTLDKIDKKLTYNKGGGRKNGNNNQ